MAALLSNSRLRKKSKQEEGKIGYELSGVSQGKKQKHKGGGFKNCPGIKVTLRMGMKIHCHL
ncbi:hypothetical protein DSO57_1031600 [Entomophthora muscae]|uniref:Uncharacterized protein n=1 Tax=Entomophthora muscae TaxID=34485 RepID=A0ACC2T0T4_9FUNG|nr:hypothetical protein DSO57_1031600 [Entomophthora muscae]